MESRSQFYRIALFLAIKPECVQHSKKMYLAVNWPSLITLKNEKPVTNVYALVTVQYVLLNTRDKNNNLHLNLLSLLSYGKFFF